MPNKTPLEPRSPKALDDKIIAYAKQNVPQQHSTPRWYGLVAGSCALVLAAVLLPSLAPQFQPEPVPQLQAPDTVNVVSADETKPMAPLVRATQRNEELSQPSADAPPSMMRMQKSVLKTEKVKALKRKVQHQGNRENLIFSAKPTSSELAQSPASDPVNMMRSAKRSSPKKAAGIEAAAGIEKAREIKNAKKVAEKLAYLAQLQKNHAKQAEQEYQLFRTQCDCELPKDLEQALQAKAIDRSF